MEIREDRDLKEIDLAPEDECDDQSLIGRQLNSVDDCSVSSQSIGYEHRSSKFHWSDGDVERLRRSKAAGLSNDEIGRVLYCSADVVDQKWNEMKKFSASLSIMSVIQM